MKKNVFDISIGTCTQSFSNKKGTESKPGSSSSTARKLTYEILRPREASLGPSANFVVHRPSPMEALPSLETPRKNPIFKGGADIIDSLTKLNEFRSSSQKLLHSRREGSLGAQPQQELAKTREESCRIAAEKRSREQAFKEQIARLERDNEALRQRAEKERNGSKASLRLMDIESQNSKIIENLQTAKASLVEKERTYVERIQALKRENLALEHELFALRRKAYEGELTASKLKNIEDHLELAALETSRERKKLATLAQSQAFLAEHLQSFEGREREELAQIAQLRAEAECAREQNATLKLELAERRGERARELSLLTQQVERLSQQLSGKDEEFRLLSSQLGQSAGGEGSADEGLEELEGENLLLSQMLAKLQKKYETVHAIAHSERPPPQLSFAGRPKPRTEQKEQRREYYGDVAIDQRLILSSAEPFEQENSLGQPGGRDGHAPAAPPRRADEYNCSFKKYGGNFFGQGDSQGRTSLGQTSGEEGNVVFTPQKRELSSAKKALAHAEYSDAKGHPARAGYSPIKRVIFNQLLSDDKDFYDREIGRQKHAHDYSLQDETTFLSVDASANRPLENLFYPTSFQNC